MLVPFRITEISSDDGEDRYITMKPVRDSEKATIFATFRRPNEVAPNDGDYIAGASIGAIIMVDMRLATLDEAETATKRTSFHREWMRP